MCGEIIEKISLYIDNQLSSEEALELKKHINECESCRKEYLEFIDMMNDIKSVPQKELPANFHAELMQKIANTEKIESPKNTIKLDAKLKPTAFAKKHKWRKYTTIAASVLTLLVVVTAAAIAISTTGRKYSYNESATGSAQNSIAPSSAYRGDYGVAEQMEESMAEMEIAYDTSKAFSTYQSAPVEMPQSAPEEDGNSVVSGSDESAGINRKIIRHSYISMEVDSFDHTAQLLKAITEQSGGYVENFQSYSNGTYYYDEQTIELKGGSIVLRIPSAKYDSINTMVGRMGKIISQSESSENVTAQYIDTEARLKVKQEEEKRLIALIEKANKIDDIIALESRLSEIRSTIESYQSTLKNYDSLVQFSTINININEKAPTAVRYEPDKSFGIRVHEGIVYSLNSAQIGLENFVINAARNMVGLIIFIALMGILLVIAFKKIIPKLRGKR